MVQYVNNFVGKYLLTDSPLRMWVSIILMIIIGFIPSYIGTGLYYLLSGFYQGLILIMLIFPLGILQCVLLIFIIMVIYNVIGAKI